MSNPWEGKASNTTGGGGQFTIPSADAHPAVLVGMVDLGVHREEYKGAGEAQDPRDVRQLYLCFELVSEKDSATSKNFIVCKQYNLSFHKKGALRLLYEELRGKPVPEGEGIDYFRMLGVACQVSISHEEGTNREGEARTYARIKAITRPGRGQIVAPPEHEIFGWLIGQEKPEVREVVGKRKAHIGGDLEAIKSMGLARIFGEKVEDKITRSSTWRALHDQQQPAQTPARGNGQQAQQPAAVAAYSDEELPF